LTSRDAIVSVDPNVRYLPVEGARIAYTITLPRPKPPKRRRRRPD
jgi:hypothetical protein